MSIENELLAILRAARAATRPRGEPGQVRAADNPAERLAAVLTEINETALPRSLIFTIGGAARLQLEARERRLALINECSGVGADAEAAQAELKGLDNDAAAECAEMARLLIAFCAVDGVLSATSEPTTLPASFVRKGQPVDDLTTAAAAAGLAPVQPAASELSEPEKVPEPGAAPQSEPDVPETADTEIAEPGREGVLPEGSPLAGLYSALSEIGTATAHVTTGGAVKAVIGDKSGPIADIGGAAAQLDALTRSFTDIVMPGRRLVFAGSGESAAPLICIGQEAREIVLGTLDRAACDGVGRAWTAALANRSS